MKILLILLGLLISFNTTIYSKNTDHYAVISAGGVFNTGMLSPKTEAQQNYDSSFLGGGFIVEAGYLAVLSNKNILHGFDTRLSFGITYNTLQKPINPNNPDLTQLTFSVNNTYQIGSYVKSGKILVDITGIGLGFACTTLYGSSPNNIPTDTFELSSFLLSVHLPLTFLYINTHGFMIGLRHKLNFLFTHSDFFGSRSDQVTYIDYAVSLNIGFAFKGTPTGTGRNYTDMHRFEIENIY